MHAIINFIFNLDFNSLKIIKIIMVYFIIKTELKISFFIKQILIIDFFKLNYVVKIIDDPRYFVLNKKLIKKFIIITLFLNIK